MHDDAMDQARAQEIANRWMMPTEESSYMGGVEKRPILASASGSTVVDTQGKEYLDFQSGQMGAAIGHRHPRVMAAVRKATETFVHASNIMLNAPRLELHERLGKLLVPPLQKSLFLVTGSDTIEASVDLARKATGGLDILGLHDGLHGSTSYISRSLSFAWKRQQHASIAPGTSAILTPHCYQCPVASSFPKCEFLCLKASLELADANFTSRPAAVIAEPMLCAAGVASIDAIVEEDLAGRAARIELRMKSALTEMATRYELIGDIRGRGVLLGLELVTDREQKTPANKEAAVVENRCLEAGLILQLRGTGPGRKNVLRFVPPMT